MNINDAFEIVKPIDYRPPNVDDRIMEAYLNGDDIALGAAVREAIEYLRIADIIKRYDHV